MTAVSNETTEIGAVLRELEPAANAQGGRLSLHLPPSSLRAGIAPQALSAVLSTVLGNARAHGGPNVEIAVHAEDEKIHIDIQDDGPGITPGHAARIFEPFFTTARDHGGTGMGLTVARALLRAYNASIELVPSATGACFRLSLRAANP